MSTQNTKVQVNCGCLGVLLCLFSAGAMLAFGWQFVMWLTS